MTSSEGPRLYRSLGERVCAFNCRHLSLGSVPMPACSGFGRIGSLPFLLRSCLRLKGGTKDERHSKRTRVIHILAADRKVTLMLLVTQKKCINVILDFILTRYSSLSSQNNLFEMYISIFTVAQPKTKVRQ